jgi:hypothetical protein
LNNRKMLEWFGGVSLGAKAGLKRNDEKELEGR